MFIYLELTNTRESRGVVSEESLMCSWYSETADCGVICEAVDVLLQVKLKVSMRKLQVY